MINLGPIVLFSSFILTTGSGKHLEDKSHAHIVSFIYKLISSGKDSYDLSIGFDRDRNRRRNELADNRNLDGKYHVRFILKDVFGFVGHQEKATYGSG